MPLYINVDKEQLAQIRALAERDHRTPRMQAEYLLRKGLEAAGAAAPPPAPQLYDALRRQNAALKARCTFLERQLAQRTQED